MNRSFSQFNATRGVGWGAYNRKEFSFTRLIGLITRWAYKWDSTVYQNQWIATNKKLILSGQNWACTCIHFVWQTSGNHRISQAWVANESMWKWVFTGLVIHNILSTRMCTLYQGVLVKSKSGGNQGRPFDNWLWSNKNLIGLQSIQVLIELLQLANLIYFSTFSFCCFKCQLLGKSKMSKQNFCY